MPEGEPISHAENDARYPGWRTDIGVAHKIATQLWDAGYRDEAGSRILSMALGIFMEAHEGAHRNLKPLTDAMLNGAQMAFDALRQGRERDAGHG